MREQICEYQESMLDTSSQQIVSRCVNSQSTYYFAMVNKPLCLECKERQLPSPKTIEFHNNILNLAPNTPQREPGEALELLTKYCHKCKFYNSKMHICDSCDCLASSSIEEKVAEATFHCPLKVF